MKTRWSKLVAICVLGILFCAGVVQAAEIRVICSGGLRAVYLELVPQIKNTTNNAIITTRGASIGTASHAIPNRMEREEPADVIIAARSAFDYLIKKGKAALKSRKSLPEPWSSVVKPRLTSNRSANCYQLNLNSRAIITTKLQCPIKTIFKPIINLVKIFREGRIKGINFVGPIPPVVQHVTIFYADVATGARKSEGANGLVKYLASPAGSLAIIRSGMDPVNST